MELTVQKRTFNQVLACLALARLGCPRREDLLDPSTSRSHDLDWFRSLPRLPTSSSAQQTPGRSTDPSLRPPIRFPVGSLQRPHEGECRPRGGVGPVRLAAAIASRRIAHKEFYRIGGTAGGGKTVEIRDGWAPFGTERGWISASLAHGSMASLVAISSKYCNQGDVAWA